MSKSSINRRSFLKKGLVATAGSAFLPQIIPASAMGNSGFVAPSDRLVIGAIGLGGMGTANMNSFLKKKEVQFVAVCDVDTAHGEAAKNTINKQYGHSDTRSYTDYREFLDKEKLDAVSIAVPDHWHGILSVAAIQKGLDVYGEKPLARTIMEGRSIVEAATAHQTVWQTGSWQRSVPHFRRAVHLVRNGILGTVTHVEVGLPDGHASIGTPEVQVPPETVDYDFWLGPAPKVPYRGILHFHWRWMMDYSGGQLTDWAGHHVDIANWGLDLDQTGPVKVEGKGTFPVDGMYNVPVEYDIKCKYENGLEMNVANSALWVRKRKGSEWLANQNRGMGTVWYGEKGWIHVNRQGLWASNPEWLKIPERELKESVYISNDHHKNFIDCVKSRKTTIAPVATAHNSISVALIGEIAMLTGQKLDWDPQKEQFTNSEYANRLLSRPFRAPWKMPEF